MDIVGGEHWNTASLGRSGPCIREYQCQTPVVMYIRGSKIDANLFQNFEPFS